MQQLQPLRPYFQSQRGRPGEVTVGQVQASDKTKIDRITDCKENNGYCVGRRLCSQNRRGCWRDNHGHLAANKVGQQCRKLVVAALGPAILDHHSTQLHCIGSALRRALSQITNHWLSGLRAHRERPRCRRPAQKFDEL